MRVRASPSVIEYISKRRPDIHIEAQPNSEFSIKNIDEDQFIGFIKASGIILERQDTILLLKEPAPKIASAPTLPLVTPQPAQPREVQAQNQEDDEENEETDSQPTTDESKHQPTTGEPKAKVFENFDQAFSGFIDGLVNFKINAIESKASCAETKVTDIETKITDALANIERLKEQDILLQQTLNGQTAILHEKLSASSSTSLHEIESLKKKLDDTKKTIEETQAAINKLNKNTLEQHETNIQQILACFEKINISLTANLDEHKKMQENVNKMAQYFKDFPLPK